jgi:hypothetical protein
MRQLIPLNFGHRVLRAPCYPKKAFVEQFESSTTGISETPQRIRYTFLPRFGTLKARKRDL